MDHISSLCRLLDHSLGLGSLFGLGFRALDFGLDLLSGGLDLCTEPIVLCLRGRCFLGDACGLGAGGLARDASLGPRLGGALNGGRRINVLEDAGLGVARSGARSLARHLWRL
jgi:hypothetical protein